MKPEFLSSPQGAALKLPFSEAVRAGGFLILSGQIGNLPGTRELVPGGIVAESRQMMDNIQAALARHGARMDDVVNSRCPSFTRSLDQSVWASDHPIIRSPDL